MDNGLVYDWTDYGNFSYKGAVSTNINTNCPYLFLNKVVGKIYKQVRYKGNLSNAHQDVKLTPNEKRFLELIANIALSVSGVAFNTMLFYIPLACVAGVSVIAFPLTLGVSLVCVGYLCYYYAYDGDFNKARQNTVESLFNSLI